MLSAKPWKLEGVLLLFTGVLSSVFVGMLAALAFTKLSPDTPPPDRKFVEFVIGSVAFQCAPLMMVHLFLRQHGTSWVDFFGLRRVLLGGVFGRAALVALLVIPIAHVLMAASTEILQAIEKKAPEIQPSIQVLQISQSLGRRVLFTFAAVVLAPVMEEILFRGVLYAVIREAGWPRLALWGSSFLFAAIHVNKMTFLPLMMFGMMLTLLYERTGRLIAPIAAHSTFNTVNMLLYHYPLKIDWLGVVT